LCSTNPKVTIWQKKKFDKYLTILSTMVQSKLNARREKKANKASKICTDLGKGDVPLVRKFIAKEEKKVTSAIHRNIESIMASRVMHGGGVLRIVKAPKDVQGYDKSMLLSVLNYYVLCFWLRLFYLSNFTSCGTTLSLVHDCHEQVPQVWAKK
jgi:hypothetical protein